MKKTIFVILAIFLIVLTCTCYFLWENQKKIENATKINREYNTYYDKTILGTDLISIINKTSYYNEKNKVEKNEKNIYQDNHKNSIKIEIKFLESDDVILMEAISNQGSEKFVKNFSAANFTCTSIEYHKSTNQVSYLMFEQVQ